MTAFLPRSPSTTRTFIAFAASSQTIPESQFTTAMVEALLSGSLNSVCLPIARRQSAAIAMRWLSLLPRATTMLVCTPSTAA